MTTDGGGWTLLATLRSTNTGEDATCAWAPFAEDWFTEPHRNPLDPSSPFSNHDLRKFKPLVGPSTVVRMTNPANKEWRYQLGFVQADWDRWNAPYTNAKVIGPFELANVKVSRSADLAKPVPSHTNGYFAASYGIFYLGTAPFGGDGDSEGLGLRCEVASSGGGGTFGYVGGRRINQLWSIWMK